MQNLKDIKKEDMLRILENTKTYDIKIYIKHINIIKTLGDRE